MALLNSVYSYTGSGPLQTRYYASTVHNNYHGLSLEGDREKQ